MPITFLDEEEDIVTATKPPRVKGRITFLDEEEEPIAPVVEPETPSASEPPTRITFLDEEPEPPTIGGLAIPPAPEVTKFEATKPKESFLRPVADPFLNIGAGINDVLKGFTDAFGADNAVSQNLAKNSEWYRGLLSAGAKEDQEEIGRIMQEAEGQGVLSEIGAGLKALSVAPVDLVSQGIGSLIPFIATAGVGKAVGLSKAGIAVLQGVQGGAVGGGIVKGEIYNAVKDQLVNSGVDEAKAEKAAQEAQAYNGKNLDQIMLGVGLGVAASTTGADSAIRSLISRKVGKETAEQVSEQAVQEVLRTGFVRGAVKDGTVEFATEALQGGQERLAANIAVGREGFDVEPMRGVVGQATLEGALGGILGGGAGGISARVAQRDAREVVALRDAQKAADEAKQNNAPAAAAAVEEQVNQTIEETPDEKVARLQREAQEGVGIDLEEEVPVSGLPPERIKSARWFESASRNRLKELQDKDDAGVEDFTTQERDEFEFLKASPTPEQIAERYGYGVAPAVEPTAVTTTTQPTTPAMTEPAPVEPEPTLTPSPAVTEPTAPTTLQPNLLTPEGKIGEERSTIDQENRRKTEEFINGLEDGEYQVFDSNGEKNGIAKVRTNKSGKKVVEYVTDDRRGFIGDAKSLVPELNFARFTDATTGKEGFDRGSIQKLTPPATEAAPEAAVTPPPVEPPALAPLRRVVKAEQTEEDVSGLVGQGLVELYNGQPVITQAGLEALPEAERPRLTPEARKIQIDTRTSEAAAEAISKNLRIGVDQVPFDVRMPAGWTLVGDIYIPPTVEAAPEVVAPEKQVIPQEQEQVAPVVKVNQEQVNQGKPDVAKIVNQFTVLERAAVAGKLLEEGYIDGKTADRFVKEATSEKIGGFSMVQIGDAQASADEKFNQQIAAARTSQPVAGEVSPAAVDLEAEQSKRLQSKKRISPAVALKPKSILGDTAREALAYLSSLNLSEGKDWDDKDGVPKWTKDPNYPKPFYAQIQDAAAILSKLPLKILDADKIISNADRGRKGGAKRFNNGDIGIPLTETARVQTASGSWVRRSIDKPLNVATLVHEVGHTLTADAVNKYVTSKNPRGSEYLKVLDTALKNKSTPQPIKDLIGLYKTTISQLGLEQEYFGKKGLAGGRARDSQQKAFDKKIVNNLTGNPFTWSQYYGLANIDEFVAQTWSSQSFQDLLKQIKAPDQQSLWTKFTRIIRDLFGFPSDSMASAVIDVSMQIAELETPIGASRGVAFSGVTIADRIAGRGEEPAPQPEARESRRAITPQQDRDYLDAVERGDLEMAQRMVDAEQLGVDLPVSPNLPKYSIEAYKAHWAKYTGSETSKASPEQSSAMNSVPFALGEDYGLPIFLNSGPRDKPNNTIYEDGGNLHRRFTIGDSVVSVMIGKDNSIHFSVDGGLGASTGIGAFRTMNALMPHLKQILLIHARKNPNVEYSFYGNNTRKLALFDRYAKRSGLEIVGQNKFRLSSEDTKSSAPVTYDDQGNVIPLSQRFQPEQADMRYNPLGYDITTVVEDIKAGRTDGPLRAVNNVVKEATAFRDRVKAEADRRQRPRARGKAAILERIARERSSGKLSEETAQALTDFVNSIREEAIGDTAISIKGAGAASNFDFGQSLVTFFLTQDQPKVGARVGIHEFWHGLSRFLPKTEAEKMAKDYTQALSGYLKDNPWFLAFVGRYSLTPEQFEEYKLFNPKEAETKLVPVQDSQGNIVKYQIKYDAENYRYIMLDEWIAEKMTDLVESRQAMPNTFMGKLAKIIKEFLAQIQAKLGRDVYQSFYNLVTDSNQKIDLQRMSGVARPFQIYQPQDYNYAEDISDQIRYAMRQREDINREYTPNTDEERKAFEKANSNKVLARNPQLAVAAVRLKNGQITAGEYADLVDSIDPFVPKGADPIPTDDKIKQYIQSDKVGKIGFFDANGNPRLEDGSEYEFRIDINTYNRSTATGDTVYNITAHESVPETSKRVGEAYAYVGVAKVTNPTFMTRAISGKGSAVEIAVGKGKFPLATVKGSYEPITELPADINDPNVWTEVGYNPVRSSFFVDTRSKQAVVGGSEAIMVGSRVFVKNAQLEARPTGITYGKAYNPLGLDPEPIPSFAIDTPEAKTLSNLKASMEKVDTASEAKGGKPETQKVSEIAANWMESGGDERALQDAITENTNLSPVNAAKVAKVIAKQYGLQQQIAETGAVIAEITPEAEGAPRKSSVTKLIEQTTGVRKPVVKLQVSESAALKKQIQLKAREARETRKARKEAAEDLAKSIADYVKANPIRGPINSRQAMSITKRALKLDVNNEAAVDRFEMYVERVIENANYDQDLADARALIKRAKTFAKSKDTQGNVKTTLDAIANISPTLLDNPFEFNLVVQRYLLGLAPVTAKQYAVMPDADVRRYLESLETQISANQDVLDRSKAQRILDKQAAYAEEKGIPLDEAIAILNSEEFLNEKTIEKLEDLTKLLTSMAQESQKDVRAYDEAGATPKQKELISFMGKVNLDSLTNEQKKRYIRFSNNFLANGATFGMEQFQSIALGQESAIKALKDKRLSNKLAAWISPIGGDKAIDTARRIALKTQSEADTFKNIFGREAVGAFRKILGLNRLDVAQTASNTAKEKIANEFGEYFKGLRKKYGNDATGFEAKGYAGIAGYLIQTDGNKTESESIPYRRRLMEQNIVELRKSDRQTDQAEADLKERALAQLTGTTNAEILSQLQALNPASYEQLMWVKDVMLPKWRDFLKEHDENFRNQANNYNNPDHLTITYKFPEGQLLPNEIEDVYQQDAIGMRIKQAANSIKRKEHSNLPVSPRTGTVANIDINFGYNQYNALVDQVDKAFVAPAWEQVVAFTKAPEFEQVMGGRANSLFVKKLLTDIQTSRTRQSMTDDEAQMVAGGVRLARKISTQAVLGGFTQPLRQIPDQLTKLFFTTGRVDLIKKNLLKTAEAAPLLNKFPIGRRGDALAGTQYASQFSELARKVEASVTDRKWAQYRELMNRVGEFWMAPLRGSDVWAAKVSWMSYYEAELNKNGIKMESWEREAELVETDDARKEAASYAEFAVDFYGGASDPTKMASLSKQTNNGWKEFAKLLFLPLNSFALQQKNSLISDLRDAYLRTGDRKASIAAISGTLAGMAAFHGMRIYIIGGLLYPAGKALLMGIFGIDMDEPDEEEKQKQLEDNWRKFKASMYGNIVAGGAGEFAEKAAIDAVNRTAYLWDANINPDSLLNDKGEIMSFRQYEKEVSPLYRFRSYGSSEYSFGLADVLTEQATHSLAETQQLLTPEEMERYTGNEQAYAAFATGVEWMYFFRLMDTDVKRIATDLKRQMDKGVEEREKEIKAIRSGR